MVEVLEIVHRHHRRYLERRQRDRQWVVDGVERHQKRAGGAPGRAAASAIANARSGILRASLYSGTGTSGSPSPAPGAAGGVKAA